MTFYSSSPSQQITAAKSGGGFLTPSTISGCQCQSTRLKVPATSIAFLSIVVDSTRLELRLPAEKITFIQHLLQLWVHRRLGRAREFESLVGHLAHAATVIQQGWTFLQHLYDILYRASSPHHFVHLDAMAKADLLWWAYFLQRWNGTMFF